MRQKRKARGDISGNQRLEALRIERDIVKLAQEIQSALEKIWGDDGKNVVRVSHQ